MATVRKLSAAHVSNSLGSDLNVVNIKLDCVNKKVDRLLLGQEGLLKQLKELAQDTSTLEKEVEGIKSGERGQRPEGSCCTCKSLHQDISQILLTLSKMYQQNDERMGSLESALTRITERFQTSESSSGLNDSQQVDRTETKLETAAQRLSEPAVTEASETAATKELSDDKETLPEKESLNLADRSRESDGEVKDHLAAKNHKIEVEGLSGSKEASLRQGAGAEQCDFLLMDAAQSLHVSEHPGMSGAQNPSDLIFTPSADPEEGWLASRTLCEQVEGVAEESHADAMAQGEDGYCTGPGSNPTREISPAPSLQQGNSCEETEAKSVKSPPASTETQPEDSSFCPSEPGLRVQTFETQPVGASQSHSVKCLDLNAKLTNTIQDEPRVLKGGSLEELRDRTNKEMLEETIPEGEGESSNHGECTESGSNVSRAGSATLFQGEQTVLQGHTGAENFVKVIDDRPPQPAPFEHRFASFQTVPINSLYQFNLQDVLGGGRFGSVHPCTERSSGLQLAMKIIKTRSVKEKDTISNEVQVMNLLNHVNLIQLYDAFETKHEMILVMEYVGGGELFERIVDESYRLTELDAMVYVKQICQGIHYMHHMYVLHLDLKPENILCVDHTGNQVKIIDFGLARRFKPREKLRVSFGTPEFLAPEIVNFEHVSFPTDMWSLGVITYMLLSGLSPFLGDTDAETLTSILTTNCSFDDEAFENISEDAKDFIANLLIREKSGRFSAAQCLKHPWVKNVSVKSRQSGIQLKSQLLLKKYVMKRLWKKNYYAIAAANRLKKISSCGSLPALAM
ncbi:myosin light chain kinase 2, skeletal/cardiac muscle-like isoform X1 [Scyliorhinus canicula]|uniref:myosin light chain kinase 2, skeletal/cardiac muscle-like isoform X1 n=1 Tax=Scyliorhinus canicula TaxID=7830 RepID=UPI0018F571D5|nr:myosin light chain kinase 2, skeletal/cardiac muscle-like isoform X1 [Scyliorhinus canicula]